MKEIIIIILLILLNGVFSMSEIALISARKSKLSSDAKRGSKTAAATRATPSPRVWAIFSLHGACRVLTPTEWHRFS